MQRKEEYVEDMEHGQSKHWHVTTVVSDQSILYSGIVRIENIVDRISRVTTQIDDKICLLHHMFTTITNRIMHINICT